MVVVLVEVVVMVKLVLLVVWKLLFFVYKSVHCHHTVMFCCDDNVGSSDDIVGSCADDNVGRIS